MTYHVNIVTFSYSVVEGSFSGFVLGCREQMLTREYAVLEKITSTVSKCCLSEAIFLHFM